MGARVYNPETNQFTSKDPIKGGNENSYTYPNDPINGSDCSGRNGWLDLGVAFFGGLVGGAICAVTAVVGCVIGGLVIGALSGFITGSATANENHLKGSDYWFHVGKAVLTDSLFGAVGGPIGKLAKDGLRYRGLFKVHASETFKDFRQEMAVGYTYTAAVYFGGMYLSQIASNKPIKKGAKH
jgi:hypothetical protein